jgi:phenylalanyl-tRNA synthetase beta chain
VKFTLSWLKEHLETEAGLDQVVEMLTRIGLEVEGVENPAEKLAPFTVAQVLTAERHPQADKLQVLTVDAGTGEAIQVVCGAPNARAGLKGVFGPPGAYVPGSDLTLKVAAIRGVESRGMMCSVRELELGDEHDGIIELPEAAPVGARFAAYAGLDDPVIDISVTPNRQDAMGVYGIARDLAAAWPRPPQADRGGGDSGRLSLPDRNSDRRSRELPGLLRPRPTGREERSPRRPGFSSG